MPSAPSAATRQKTATLTPSSSSARLPAEVLAEAGVTAVDRPARRRPPGAWRWRRREAPAAPSARSLRIDTGEIAADGGTASPRAALAAAAPWDRAGDRGAAR